MEPAGEHRADGGVADPIEYDAEATGIVVFDDVDHGAAERGFGESGAGDEQISRTDLGGRRCGAILGVVLVLRHSVILSPRLCVCGHESCSVGENRKVMFEQRRRVGEVVATVLTEDLETHRTEQPGPHQDPASEDRVG